ncbi:hypothetical protein ACJX0J_036361, partial [Zea mays]
GQNFILRDILITFMLWLHSTTTLIQTGLASNKDLGFGMEGVSHNKFVIFSKKKHVVMHKNNWGNIVPIIAQASFLESKDSKHNLFFHTSKNIIDSKIHELPILSIHFRLRLNLNLKGNRAKDEW